MLDAQNGWGIGAGDDVVLRVLRTADGGLTWRDVSPPMPIEPDAYDDLPNLLSYPATSAFFLDDQHAWIIHRSSSLASLPSLWITQDSGASWTEVAECRPCWLSVETTLHFADERHGWIMTYDGQGAGNSFTYLYRTTDGGRTWETLSDPQDGNESGFQGCYKVGLSPLDAQAAWVTYECFMQNTWGIERTSDGGAHWDWLDYPVPPEAAKILENKDFYGSCIPSAPQVFPPKTVLMLVMCSLKIPDGDEVLHVYRSEDGGQTWHVTRHPDTMPGCCPVIPNFVMLDSKTGWSVGKAIYQTVDGGDTWTYLADAPWYDEVIASDPAYHWVKVEFADALNGWGVTYDYEALLRLYRTIDGGKTWTPIEPHLE